MLVALCSPQRVVQVGPKSTRTIPEVVYVVAFKKNRGNH